MSRTFKDKPYSVIEENARSCGFSHTRTFGWGYSFEEIDLKGYAYSRKKESACSRTPMVRLALD